MIDYKVAQQLVLKEVRSFGREQIDLEQALGRVLAESVVADRDYPPFNRSMMDGYAVRSSELKSGITNFRITETLYAGSSPTIFARAQECYKIMTGAPVPGEMDVVIQKEEAIESSGTMNTDAFASRSGTLPPYLNIARKGEDLRSGQLVIDKASLCTPSVVGVLASVGKTRLLVEAQPKILIITTGNEVVPIDATPGGNQIRNSNRWLLQSLLAKKGIEPVEFQHAVDDVVILKERILYGLSFDILIICGGVSAGDADFVPTVLEDSGVRKLFHKMSIRPGKPTWCGVSPTGTLVFALPGNPVSCLVNFVLLIQPYLNACFGRALEPPVGLPLGVSKKKKTQMDEFFLVRLQGFPGSLLPVFLNSSGDIRLGSAADGFALHPSDSGDLSEGMPVAFYPL